MSVQIQEKQVQTPVTPGFGDLPPFVRFRFGLMGAVRGRTIFRSFQRLSSGQDFDSRESIFNHSEVLRALVQARAADAAAAALLHCNDVLGK